MFQIKDFDSPIAKTRFEASKQAIKLSAENPKRLYREIDFFVGLLDHDNQVMQWTGVIVLGNLAAVDRAGKIDRLLPRLFSNLKSGQLVLASNTVKALGVIANVKPKQRLRILKQLLKVTNYPHKTTECKNILIGKVIEVLAEFPIEVRVVQFVKFIRLATKNPRPAVKKKATKLLEKLESS